MYTEHQLNVSQLQELHVGLVTSFALDSMHLVYLGVTRRLMSRWIKGPRPTKFSHLQLDIISGKLVNLARHVPSEFSRKPRSLHELDRWKATEFRQFLLYTSIVVLKSDFDATLYNHFLCLSTSMLLLSNSELEHHHMDYVEELLVYFVTESIDLYGENFIVYNVHNLTQIVDDVRQFGCLDGIISFLFENFLGRMKYSVRKPQFVLQQISNRLSEGYFKSKDYQTCTVVCKREHCSGYMVNAMMNMKQYKEIRLSNCVLKTRA